MSRNRLSSAFCFCIKSKKKEGRSKVENKTPRGHDPQTTSRNNKKRLFSIENQSNKNQFHPTVKSSLKSQDLFKKVNKQVSWAGPSKIKKNHNYKFQEDSSRANLIKNNNQTKLNDGVSIIFYGKKSKVKMEDKDCQTENLAICKYVKKMYGIVLPPLQTQKKVDDDIKEKRQSLIHTKSKTLNFDTKEEIENSAKKFISKKEKTEGDNVENKKMSLTDESEMDYESEEGEEEEISLIDEEVKDSENSRIEEEKSDVSSVNFLPVGPSLEKQERTFEMKSSSIQLKEERVNMFSISVTKAKDSFIEEGSYFENSKNDQNQDKISNSSFGERLKQEINFTGDENTVVENEKSKGILLVEHQPKFFQPSYVKEMKDHTEMERQKKTRKSKKSHLSEMPTQLKRSVLDQLSKLEVSIDKSDKESSKVKYESSYNLIGNSFGKISSKKKIVTRSSEFEEEDNEKRLKNPFELSENDYKIESGED